MTDPTIGQLRADIERLAGRRELPTLTVEDGWRTKAEWREHLRISYSTLQRLIRNAKRLGCYEESETVRRRSDSQDYIATVSRMNFDSAGDTGDTSDA